MTLRIVVSVGMWLLIPSVAQASCIEVPAPGVPRHLRTSVGLTLVRAAGLQGELTDGQGRQLSQSPLDTACLPSEDPTGILTDAAMLAQYQADEAARQSAAQTEATRQQGFTDEITANDLCTGELADFVTRVNSEQSTIQGQIDSATNVAGVKTAMTTMNTRVAAALKKLAKCIRARAR